MDPWLGNLLAHAMQSLALVLVGAAAARLLRDADPRLRLALWQSVLAAMVLLPFVQPWRPASDLLTATITLSVAGEPGREARAPIIAIPLGLAFLWAFLAGALARAAWIAVGWLRLRRIAAAAIPLSPRPGAVDRAIEEVGATATFLVTPDFGPVSFGIRRAWILVPAAFATLDCRAQHLIARHELLHIRRRDFAHALAEEALTTLLWPYPWTWWVRAQIRIAREQTVDRAVVQETGSRVTYVRSLLAMAGHAVPPLPGGAAVPHVRELYERIDALYREVTMSRPRALITTVVIAVALAAMGTAAMQAFPLRTIAMTAGSQQSDQEDDPVRVGGDVKPPRKVKHVPPVYPPDAVEAGVEGVVVLEIVVGRDGLVRNATVVKSVPELDTAAIDAVLQWEFEPTYVKGKAVAVRMTITVNFTLAP